MRLQNLMACAGLAMAVPAMGQVVDYLTVPNATNGIMLFSPQDGTIINPSFIPDTGPGYTLGTVKCVTQVGNEFWLPQQTSPSAIWRFDHNGKYIGAIVGDMNNIRTATLHNGIVYVTNDGASGQTPIDSVIRYDMSGNYLSNFPVDTSPYDIMIFNGEMLISDSNGSPDVGRYDIATGAFLGTFHDGTMSFAQQVAPKSNGNVLVAAFTTASVFELDPTGANVTQSPTVSSARGAWELGNGNVLCAGTNIHIWDTTAGTVSQVAAGASQYVRPVSINTSAVGACCSDDGTCSITTIAACAATGVFRGDGTVCASANCPPLGACCAPDGTCTFVREIYCATLGSGGWTSGAACGSVTCPMHLVTPAPATSSATAGSGIFFNLTGLADLEVTRIDYQPGTAAGNAVVVDIYTISGTYVGNDTNAGAWTHVGTISTTSQGNAASSPLTTLTLPGSIHVPQNQTVGVYLIGTTGGYRYRATTTTNPVADANLSLASDLARSLPFAGTAAARRFAGNVYYQLVGGPTCYANCDQSTTAPVLNVGDFTCFLQRFAAGEAYANCDESTTAPTLNVGDFTCFLQKFAAGCP